MRKTAIVRLTDEQRAEHGGDGVQCAEPAMLGSTDRYGCGLGGHDRVLGNASEQGADQDKLDIPRCRCSKETALDLSIMTSGVIH